MAIVVRQWVLAAAVLAIGPGVTASAQAPVALTLDDAIRRGLDQAPRLAEARAREEAARSSVAARETLGRPVVNATAGYLRTNHVIEFGIQRPDGPPVIIFPDVPSNYRARGELTVPIYTSGRVDALVESARADERAATADARAVEQDLRLEIARAYWLLVTLRANVQVLEGAVRRADASVADVKARTDAGVLAPNELLSSQAQRARQAVRLIQAQNDAAIAEMDLARLTGVPLGQHIDVATPVDQPSAAVVELASQPVETLVTRARDRRPERGGFDERQATLRATGEAALAAMRPQVSGLAAVEPSRPNPRFVPRTDRWHTSWDLGVTLTVPIWDGGRARAEYASASAQAEAVARRKDDFDAGLAVDVRARLLDLASTRAALDASAEGVTAATEARRVLDERFAAGVATSTEVLDAQVAQLEAELERTRLAAAVRLAEARFLRAVGGQ